MSVTIIKKGKEQDRWRRDKCGHCGCRFKYQKKDVLQEGYFALYYYVRCPQCGNRVCVEK